ncbi:ATP-dependent zinc metalloprotease FtsH [Pseudobdellovibrio exovorus]|uniref:ATP-dependent zinc metalloprotease FtsH n=1 Tax=Pseudobdellovibrio exovorus JSS TaxID=1184267 RepID=M4VQZ9_9BACT|nr:ATP-dependent zinc metalloprotease FtsH [Pseudobdellovibrio exovorus]AGH95589.1 cell division protein [Pseudobdellovibrio exovorus JSS]
MKANQKTFALWFALIVLTIFMFRAWDVKHQKTIQDFNYSKLLRAVELKEIAEDKVVFIQDRGEIRGEIKPEFEKKYGGTQFLISGNISDKGFEELQKHGITPNYESSQSDSLLSSILINWLPLLLIVGMFIFIMRQIQVGGGKAMSFGKSRARLVENKNRVTFKDVAGVDEAKDDLQEIVHFLKDPKKFTKLGGRIPKGVLLVGPPGTGKTLLARAVAGEAGVPFFTISGSDFVEMFVGVGASRVRDLFEQGKKSAPCLIFIDEIDAVGRHRGAGMGGGHDEREQTLNQLLVEMDGFESTEGVILIAATNRPDVLDPALLRPGRFDRRVVVGKPDLKGREQILSVHTKKTPLGSDVEISKIARGTPGFSGADLENLVNEAALVAARADKKYLEMEDFEKAKDKVIMGSERKSMVISEEDKRTTAYHEAGHTLVGMMLPGLDPIHKVTIIPRGMALGLTQTLPEKDAVSFSKHQAENWIAFAFGGRAAEELIFKDFTTGAANDIERATGMARKMVCEWGMSPLGPLAYEKNDSPVFLGMGYGQKTREYSESKAQEIDSEISRIINEGYTKAMDILVKHKDALERLTQALLEFETIDGNEVDMLVKGAAVSEIQKVRSNKKDGGSVSGPVNNADSTESSEDVPNRKPAPAT